MKPMPNILLVDDDPGILQRLSTELEQRYLVHPCLNGEDAFKKIKLTPGGFRFAMIDYRLGAGASSGLEIVRSLAESSRETFILLYSNVLAETPEEVARRQFTAYDAGAHRFLQRQSGEETLAMREFVSEMMQLESMRERIKEFYENRQHIPSVLQLLHLGVDIIDRHHKVWYMNDEMRRITGIGADAIPKRPCFDWHGYKIGPCPGCLICYAASLKDPVPTRIFLSPLPKRGPGLFYLRIWTLPVTDEMGKVICGSDHSPLAITETVEDLMGSEQLSRISAEDMLGYVAIAINERLRPGFKRIQPFKHVAIYVSERNQIAQRLTLTASASYDSPNSAFLRTSIDPESMPKFQQVLFDAKTRNIGTFIEGEQTDASRIGNDSRPRIYWAALGRDGALSAMVCVSGDQLTEEDLGILPPYVAEVARIVAEHRRKERPEAIALRTEDEELARIDRRIVVADGSPHEVLKLLLTEACRLSGSFAGHLREQRGNDVALLRLGPHEYDAYEQVAQSYRPLTHLSSLATRTILSGVELVVNDVTPRKEAFDHDRRALSPPARAVVDRAQSICFLPLVFDDKCLGVIGLHNDRPHGFPEEILRLLRELARRATMALHDLQVGREQEERDRYLEVSDKITRLLVAHPFDLRAIVEGTAKILVDKGGYFRVLICLVNARRTHIQAVASHCADPSKDFKAHPGFRTNFPLRKPQADIQPSVVKSGEACRIDDATVDRPKKPKTQTVNCRVLGMKAICVMPLCLGKEVIGTLHVERCDKERVDDWELKHLQTVADRIAVVFHQAERVVLQEMALRTISDHIRIISPLNEVLFLNRGHIQGWLQTPLSSSVLGSVVGPVGKRLYRLAKRADEDQVRHFVRVTEAGETKAYDWELKKIRDFRQHLPLVFEGADSCIGFIERALDLSGIYDLSNRLREWLLCQGMSPLAKKILAYLKKLGFRWASLYLVSQNDQGAVLRSYREFGLRNVKNQKHFREGGISFLKNGPDDQPWFVLEKGIELAAFQIDQTVPEGRVRELPERQGVPRFGVSKVQYGRELEKDDQEWLEIALLVGPEQIGKITLSLPSESEESDVMATTDLELLKMQALGIAVALYQASRAQEKQRLAQAVAQTAVESQKREYWRRVSYEIAHQITNPLSAQAQFVASLRHRLSPISSIPADAFERIDDIARTASRINSLITRILELARQSPLALSTFSLGEAVSEAWRHVTASCPEAAKIRFEPKGSRDLKASADHACLLSVLDALLTNAVKYGKAGGRIKCGCYGYYRSSAGPVPTFMADYCCIVVSDSGPGLPKKIVENLAEPFKANAEGTGLGLAIAWHQVQRMNGQLAYLKDSPLGIGGATFAIALHRPIEISPSNNKQSKT